ncbi:unnamed protein product [Triticum turgidum subsp. durum]|uniref:DUF4220 domain-containing protein n=1 Tax=Triticum turgidum subsp. durum TaxID=4567 RepID=A0A9R1AU07_TRITD|nr:unnamed protein product [Triticum turgidum subsp. durum]
METKNATGGRGRSITECTSFATMERSLLQLEAAVLVSGLVLAVMVLNGITRRPDSDRLLRSVIWGAYSLSYGMVAYAVGLVQERSFFHSETFSLWVTALLLLQAPSRDMDQLKARLLHHVLQTGLVLWLVVNSLGHNASYRAATWAFWSLNVLKTAVKIVEVFKARPLRPSAEVVAEYMGVEEVLAGDQMPTDPRNMTGYKYLFHGEETIQLMSGSHDEILTMMSSTSAKEVITIDQVYGWIDAQGYSEVEKDMAKDVCLAFSLFKLLKRRFYGYNPAEARSRKSLGLVLTGLIHQAVTGPDAAFRVVEVELTFLYDFFYTRNIVLTGARTHIFTAVVVLGLSMWATFFGTLGRGYSRMIIGVRNLDRAVTVVIVVIIAALELCQAVARLYDNWRYIETVYRCVRDNRPWSKRPRRQLWWKESITPPETMYWDWEQMTGQYVLLQWYDHRPWNVLSWLTLEIVKPLRRGQKRDRRQALPRQVRQAVLVSLKASRGELTNGVATVQRYGLSQQLTWACMLPKVTDQILLWHVATTRFDWTSGGDATDDVVDNHRLVARKLSNYCAYLVAFVPEMLPDPSYNADKMFDMAVKQARNHLVGCRTMPDILAKLDEIQSKEESYLEGGSLYGRAGNSSIIEKAAMLGGQLMASVPDQGRRWKVLAEFWAEFILFLAPSDNVDIHAEMLGAGGEFMT